MKERGAIVKQRGKNLHTAVLFPEDYNLAMSSLAFQSIYSHINSIDGVLCDRFVSNISQSIEHNLNLRDYKVVFITVPFILDTPKVLNICYQDLAPIDFTKVVCIGGISAAANPDIYGICDNVIVFPNSLESHKEHIRTILDLVKAGAHRKEIINEMKPLVEKCDMAKKERHPFEHEPPVSVLYTDKTEFSNMHLIEISRGCQGNCRFCMSKHIYGYYREFGYESIIRAIDKAPPEIRTIGLIGDSVLSHSRINDIVDYIIHKGKRPSFASIRIADLRPEMINLILKSEIKTLTIAPEVATDKMMKVTNKYYNPLLLFDMLKEMIKGGVVNIKLYMMIGLPGETNEDVEATICFIKDIRNILISSSKEKGRLGMLRVSVNNFVPSPFTPMSGNNPDSIENLEHKQATIKKQLSGLSNLSLSLMDIFETLYQTALFRADASFAERIINIGSKNPAKRFKEDIDFRQNILSLCYGKK